jgi:HEAT repeat protein
VVVGRDGDPATIRPLLDHADPGVRATAFDALARCGSLTSADLARGVSDVAPLVRSRVARVLARPAVAATERELLCLLDDVDPSVSEVACFAAGERSPASGAVVERLARIATAHDDALCRESAVAALGSLGDEGGRAAVIAACSDKATVRRRAVLALVAFDGDDVDAMLEQMTHDADWQVRQAAEELSSID